MPLRFLLPPLLFISTTPSLVPPCRRCPSATRILPPLTSGSRKSIFNYEQRTIERGGEGGASKSRFVSKQGRKVANDGTKEGRLRRRGRRRGIIIYLAATVIFINQRIYSGEYERREREREREGGVEFIASFSFRQPRPTSLPPRLLHSSTPSDIPPPYSTHSHPPSSPRLPEIRRVPPRYARGHTNCQPCTYMSLGRHFPSDYSAINLRIF